MTIEELRTYLAEMTEATHLTGPFSEATNIEIICARMWKRFTPQALTMWTTPGVLDHIAECLTPPSEDTENEDDE